MSTHGLPAQVAVDQVLADAAALPAFLAGSAVAAAVYGHDYAYSDVDLFVPSQGVYYALITRLLERGYTPASDRYAKQWKRHLRYGFNGWHTNSMQLRHPELDMEVNVIYKKIDGHETTQLSQVLESFDFGLLAVGYETETGTFRDLRGYMFPGLDPTGPLPLIGYRHEHLGSGFMSQHLMLRTAGRYARYVAYGYDLSAVKPVLVQGYLNYAEFMRERTSDDKQLLGIIAEKLAALMESDDIAALRKFEQDLPMQDGLDEILDSLI